MPGWRPWVHLVRGAHRHHGLATAIETRQFTWVFGGEHYIDIYSWAADIGAPVVHPITPRMYGAIGLTCRNRVDVRHRSVAQKQAVASVTDTFYEGSSDRERLLLRRFLEATRRGSANEALLLLSERMMLSNPPATWLLKGIDNEILWEQAVDAVCAAGGDQRGPAARRGGRLRHLGTHR